MIIEVKVSHRNACSAFGAGRCLGLLGIPSMPNAKSSERGNECNSTRCYVSANTSEVLILKGSQYSPMRPSF
jgi:hypothetical protein